MQEGVDKQGDYMSKYDLGIIDGQFILRRNMSMQASNGEKINGNLLMKTFMQSIMKQKRDFSFDKTIILWDRAPYLAQMGIEDYKQDRVYENQNDVDALRAELVLEGDPEKIRELERRIAEVEVKAFNNSTSGQIKYEIFRELPQFGFYCMMKKGWEADYFAFALSEKCLQYGLKAIMISTDKDWCAYRNRNVQYSTPKGDNRFEHVKWLLNFSQSLEIPMYEIGVLRELYDMSHNNAPVYEYKKDVPFETFAVKLYNQDMSLKGFDRVNKRYQALNIRRHLSDVEKYIDFTLSRTDLASPIDWMKFLGEREIKMSIDSYTKFRTNANRNLLENVGEVD